MAKDYRVGVDKLVYSLVFVPTFTSLGTVVEGLSPEVRRGSVELRERTRGKAVARRGTADRRGSLERERLRRRTRMLIGRGGVVGEQVRGLPPKQIFSRNAHFYWGPPLPGVELLDDLRLPGEEVLEMSVFAGEPMLTGVVEPEPALRSGDLDLLLVLRANSLVTKRSVRVALDIGERLTLGQKNLPLSSTNASKKLFWAAASKVINLARSWA